jgi:hypothetical protein
VQGREELESNHLGVEWALGSWAAASTKRAQGNQSCGSSDGEMLFDVVAAARKKAVQVQQYLRGILLASWSSRSAMQQVGGAVGRWTSSQVEQWLGGAVAGGG